jgi:aminoglycoside phosphotransferase (APT) family kinase protein
VEYDVKIRRPDAKDEKVTLIGKMRVRRSGNEAYRLQDEIWNAGFAAGSADGISVPEPIGVIADFQMWFQRKVGGVTAEEFFLRASKEESIALARRVAAAIHKLHRAGVPTEKTHTMADELRILRTCFEKVILLRPEWTERLERLLAACEKLGRNLPPPVACGIHRDFYSSQVIVDGPPSDRFSAAGARLWLIDFDLYCLGDPGLDAGNFIGHITEQALREYGSEAALREVEWALEEHFVELSGEQVRASVQAYSTLTLARHVYLSTQFTERHRLTAALLELCEQRLGLRSPG